MSVVAITKLKNGKFEIAADSARIGGWTKTEEAGYNGKLWRLKDMVVGHSGSCEVGNLFREFMETARPKSNTYYGWTTILAEFGKYIATIDNALKQTSHFIVVYKKRAWLIEGFYVQQIRRMDAIGAGSDFALAALRLGHSAKRACELACELSVYCNKPVKYFTAN